jgi:rhodanese-related sulfurtransferase
VPGGLPSRRQCLTRFDTTTLSRGRRLIPRCFKLERTDRDSVWPELGRESWRHRHPADRSEDAARFAQFRAVWPSLDLVEKPTPCIDCLLSTTTVVVAEAESSMNDLVTNLAGRVVTVGELEVIEHAQAGHRLVDCRLVEYAHDGTIPGALNIPHDEINARIGELDRAAPTVLFCNGPQCPATAKATDAMLAAGWPPERLLYYRGGIHDWLTLGFPLAAPAT